MKITDKKLNANRANLKLAYAARCKPKVKISCLNCHNIFDVFPCNAARTKYCSWKCRKNHMKGGNAPNSNGGKWMNGDGNPRWKGGVTVRERCAETAKWRRRVFSRDKYTCQKCGLKPKKTGQLNAHHIIPWSVNYYTRYMVNNGVTLCISCHKKIHKDGWETYPSPEYLEVMMGYPIGWTEIDH